MHFDLIITTRDRKRETLRFFDSLSHQEGTRKIRVLFVDQGLFLHSDALELLAHRRDISLQTRDIPPSALSVARNEAIAMGLCSEIVGFPDDDCWYSPAVLDSIQSIFDKHPEVKCVCTNVFDPDRGLSYGGRPVGARIRVNFSNIFSLPISVGIFVRRETFEAVGARFDETLGAGTALGSGEETELIARLLEYGAEILYVGDISVYHPVPNYDQSDASKFYAYGMGYGYLASQFIRRGHYIVMLNLVNIIARSVFGFIVYILNKTKRNVYWSRLNGVFRGSYRAFTEVKNFN